MLLTASLMDILEVRDTALSEEEMWSMLCLGVELIHSNSKKDINLHSHINPFTIGCSRSGRVNINTTLNRNDQFSSTFRSPESFIRESIQEEYIRCQACVYSLGSSLLYGASYKKPVPLLSPDLKNLLSQMIVREVNGRIDALTILQTCQNVSRVYCRGLSYSHYITKLYLCVFGSDTELTQLENELKDVHSSNIPNGSSMIPSWSNTPVLPRSNITPVLSPPYRRNSILNSPQSSSFVGSTPNSPPSGRQPRQEVTNEREPSPNLHDWLKNGREISVALDRMREKAYEMGWAFPHSYLQDQRESPTAYTNGSKENSSGEGDYSVDRKNSPSIDKNGSTRRSSHDQFLPAYHEHLVDASEDQIITIRDWERSRHIQGLMQMTPYEYAIAYADGRLANIHSPSSTLSGPFASSSPFGGNIDVEDVGVSHETFNTTHSVFTLTNLSDSGASQTFGDGTEQNIPSHKIKKQQETPNAPRKAIKEQRLQDSLDTQRLKKGLRDREFYGPEFREYEDHLPVKLTPLKSKTATSSDCFLIHIHLLSHERLEVECDSNTTGQSLYTAVISRLGLTEHIYFGLGYWNDYEFFFLPNEDKYKLSKMRSYLKQRQRASNSYQQGGELINIYFRVKHYLPHGYLPSQGKARHFFYLQLRFDVLQCLVPIADDSEQFRISGLAVQAEFGDRDKLSDSAKRLLETINLEDYIPSRFIDMHSSHREEELRRRVLLMHNLWAGITTPDAELLFIQEIQNLPFYGIHSYRVYQSRNDQNSLLHLGVSREGLHFLEKHDLSWSQLRHHEWVQLRKLSHRKDKLLIQLRSPVKMGKSNPLILTKCYADNSHKSRYLLWFCTEQHVFVTSHHLPQVNILTEEMARKNAPESQETVSKDSFPQFPQPPPVSSLPPPTPISPKTSALQRGPMKKTDTVTSDASVPPYEDMFIDYNSDSSSNHELDLPSQHDVSPQASHEDSMSGDEEREESPVASDYSRERRKVSVNLQTDDVIFQEKTVERVEIAVSTEHPPELDDQRKEIPKDILFEVEDEDIESELLSSHASHTRSAKSRPDLQPKLETVDDISLEENVKFESNLDESKPPHYSSQSNLSNDVLPSNSHSLENSTSRFTPNESREDSDSEGLVLDDRNPKGPLTNLIPEVTRQHIQSLAYEADNEDELPTTETSDVESVVLEKSANDSGYGFSVVDISRPGYQGIYIGTVVPKGIAQNDGRLRCGDQIISVNHISFHERQENSLEKIIAIIKNSERQLHLRVTRKRGEQLSSSSAGSSSSADEQESPSAALELSLTKRRFSLPVKSLEPGYDSKELISSPLVFNEPPLIEVPEQKYCDSRDFILQPLLPVFLNSEPNFQTRDEPELISLDEEVADIFTNQDDFLSQFENENHHSRPNSAENSLRTLSINHSANSPYLSEEPGSDYFLSGTDIEIYSDGADQPSKRRVSSHVKFHPQLTVVNESHSETPQSPSLLHMLLSEDPFRFIDNYFLYSLPMMKMLPVSNVKSIKKTPINGLFETNSEDNFEVNNLRLMLQKLQEWMRTTKVEEEFNFLRRPAGGGTFIPSSYDATQIPENAKKNRYTNIVPFSMPLNMDDKLYKKDDYNRVRLSHPGASNPPASSTANSDYINASRVSLRVPSSHSSWEPVDFIVTQGPLPTTVSDFWRMILQEGVKLLAMITREREDGQIKCHRYWPTKNDESLLLEDIGIRIDLEDEKNFDSFILRSFRLRDAKTNRAILRTFQMNYLDWPDHGEPRDLRELAKFVSLLRFFQTTLPKGGPIVIHCNAGVGRSGIFMLIYCMAIHILSGQPLTFENDRSPLCRAAMDLYKQRKDVFQSKNQYYLCYKAVVDFIEFLLSGGEKARMYSS